MFAFVLLMSFALFGYGSTTGKLTKDNFMEVPKTYLKEFCGELLQKKLLDALQACCENNNHPELQEAIKTCIAASGKGATSYYDFLKAACADCTIKQKFMECLEKYADDPEFLKKAAQHANTETCYDKTFKHQCIKKVEGLHFKFVDE